MQLYPDQEEVVSAVRRQLTKTRATILVSPTGSGKTAMALYMIRGALKKGRRIGFTVPRKDLLEQTSQTFAAQGIEHGFIAAGKKYEEGKQLYLGMVDTMANRIDTLPPLDMLFPDECFTGETEISTPKGKTPIAKMSLGDKVYTATGVGQVICIAKSVATEIYEVELNDGTKIRTTENHPFLSKHGWIRCSQMGSGDELFGIQDMPGLWRALSPPKKKEGNQCVNKYIPSISKRIYSAEILLDILLKEDRELYELGRNKEKSERNLKKDRAQTIATWWERQRVNGASENGFGDDGQRMASRICSANQNSEGERVPDMLQAGLSKCRKNGWNRN